MDVAAYGGKSANFLWQDRRVTIGLEHYATSSQAEDGTRESAASQSTTIAMRKQTTLLRVSQAP
jgi:hypothetical protein